MQNDLIRRRDALDALQIVAAWSTKEQRKALGQAYDKLYRVDAVDAVPVVRCKDCVGSSLWNDKLICERISNVMDGYYHGTVEVVNPDDYCSRGIRQTAKPCGAKMDGGELS